LLPALRHYRRARDLCPLLPVPQVRLATFAEYFTRAEPRQTYLDRVKRLRPSDPELWYLVGVQEFRDGDTARAWRSWRHSLEGSDRRLADVLVRIAPLPDAAASLVETLPERADYFYQAAMKLPPEKNAPGRALLLEKALKLVPANSPKGADWQIKAAIHQALGQTDEALSAYRTAVAREPDRAEWRLEYAKVLRKKGHLKEAREEAMRVVRERKDLKEAEDLYNEVTERLREGR
jgi:tetratricopeptide (TPR) repeat protein